MKAWNIGRLMAIMCALGLACAMDGAEIRNMTAKRRYPWNGLVYITCKVSGIDRMINGHKFVVPLAENGGWLLIVNA